MSTTGLWENDKLQHIITIPNLGLANYQLISISFSFELFLSHRRVFIYLFIFGSQILSHQWIESEYSYGIATQKQKCISIQHKVQGLSTLLWKCFLTAVKSKAFKATMLLETKQPWQAAMYVPFFLWLWHTEMKQLKATAFPRMVKISNWYTGKDAKISYKDKEPTAVLVSLQDFTQGWVS